jgi:hypothetical protein
VRLAIVGDVLLVDQGAGSCASEQTALRVGA